MREIQSHKGNHSNNTLTVKVVGAPGEDRHCYVVSGYDSTTNPSALETECRDRSVVLFQDGPVAKCGVNGLTPEVLLAICIDRLESLQHGPMRCRENALALAKMQEAMLWLHTRTNSRVDLHSA